jgi:hypothetical protein
LNSTKNHKFLVDKVLK